METGKSLDTQQVLQKAEELARADSIDAVGYNRLARELNIRPQSMYRYVRNIRELRTHLLRMFLTELAKEVEARVTGATPKERLMSYAFALYDCCHENPRYYEALGLMHRDDLVAEMKEPLSRLVAITEREFAALEPDPAIVAKHQQLFMAVNLGYAQMAMVEFFPSNLHDSRAMFEESIVELFDKFF